MKMYSKKNLKDLVRRPSEFLRKDLHQSEIEKEQENELKEKNCTKALNILRALLIRFIFLGEIGFFIYYLTQLTDNYFYLFMLIGPIIIICDGIYMIFARFGKEFSWYVYLFIF